MNKETVTQLYNFVIAQTVAYESFEFSKNEMLESFKIGLDTKYKNYFNSNRKIRKQIEKKKQDEIKEFLSIFKRYQETTLSMVNHFDSWITDNLDEVISETSDFIEGKVKEKR